MPARHAQLIDWFSIPPLPTGPDLGALKNRLADEGIKQRAWRLYHDFGDALFDALGSSWIRPDRFRTSRDNALCLLRALGACELDMAPPASLLGSMHLWQIPNGCLGDIPPRFLRAAWKATVLAALDSPADPQATERFVQNDVVPVAAWFFGTLHGAMDDNRLAAGWTAIMAAYRVWTRQEAARINEWSSLVRRVEAQGYRFDVLTSEAALEIEGETMCHCIGDYGDQCREGSLRAYAVSTLRGERVATLTVNQDRARGWYLDAIKGKYNAPVAVVVEEAAFALLRSLDDAQALRTTERKKPVARSIYTHPMACEDYGALPF